MTWRLYGSLPRVRDLSADSVPASEGERFALADRELDDARSGPKWLANPRIAAVVVDTLFTAQLRWKLCDLFVWVLMSNHVHVLLKPHKPLREVTRAIKSASARQANIVLGHTGHPFWQDESYDHWVRSDREFESIARYIEQNPVRAGLVQSVEKWPWSSASKKFRQVGDLPHDLPHGLSHP
ncbi:MAG TPA: transposase [Bryobacteraceae bacterium]|nr:transposase [Bryobacteraceae bacterium]